MKAVKKISSFLFALGMIFWLGVPALAAESVVEYSGHNVFGFGPGSEFSETDLFDGFKGVLPGDELTEKISIKNTADCCDFIKVYLRAEPHGQENPLSPEVEAAESLESMKAFLAEIWLTVEQNGQVIFEGAPEAGGPAENLLLGTLRRGQGTELDLTLSVPAELGNEFAGRVGEVDWVFVVEEYQDEVPEVPDTGNHARIGLYAAVMGLSLVCIVILLLVFKRKKED